MLVEFSYTTGKNPKSVLSLSLKKKNYKVDTGVPTDKKTFFQLVESTWPEEKEPEGSAGQQNIKMELGNTRGFAGSSLVS